MFQINWDANSDRTQCKTGIGIIAQDCEQMVLAIMRMNKYVFPDPHLAKIEEFLVKKII